MTTNRHWQYPGYYLLFGASSFPSGMRGEEKRDLASIIYQFTNKALIGIRFLFNLKILLQL